MFVCGGLGLYFHGQEGLAAIFSLFAAILEKFNFLVLCPLVGPLCIVDDTRLPNSSLTMATFEESVTPGGAANKTLSGFL